MVLISRTAPTHSRYNRKDFPFLIASIAVRGHKLDGTPVVATQPCGFVTLMPPDSAKRVHQTWTVTNIRNPHHYY
jgi:hypothetical protein